MWGTRGTREFQILGALYWKDIMPMIWKIYIYWKDIMPKIWQIQGTMTAFSKLDIKLLGKSQAVQEWQVQKKASLKMTKCKHR